jgi:hypothetical protein
MYPGKVNFRIYIIQAKYLYIIKILVGICQDSRDWGPSALMKTDSIRLQGSAPGTTLIASMRDWQGRSWQDVFSQKERDMTGVIG